MSCKSVVVFSVSTSWVYFLKSAWWKDSTHPSLLSHPAIFQLHAHQAWHCWNVPAQLPHKNPHLQSLAPISPLAKLPSRAVDLQMCFLQSPAQHEMPQTEEATRSCISKGPRGKITARTKRWLGRQRKKMTHKKRNANGVQFIRYLVISVWGTLKGDVVRRAGSGSDWDVDPEHHQNPEFSHRHTISGNHFHSDY